MNPTASLTAASSAMAMGPTASSTDLEERWRLWSPWVMKNYWLQNGLGN